MTTNPVLRKTTQQMHVVFVFVFVFFFLIGKILKGFDNGLVRFIILTDLQKAFSYDILLKKLSTIAFL